MDSDWDQLPEGRDAPWGTSEDPPRGLSPPAAGSPAHLSDVEVGARCPHPQNHLEQLLRGTRCSPKGCCADLPLALGMQGRVPRP